MDFHTTESAANAPAGYMPWFSVPTRATANTPVVFGHWSTLGLRNEPNLIALDTGCVWGGQLTLCRLPDGLSTDTVQNVNLRQFIQVQCAQHLAPF
jgi:bis(5'-nucleosyl)-tetraphosphatase (symmetrical)